MIRWNLNRVMAEKRVTGRWLAENLGVHPNTISRLRRAEIMPQLDSDRLGSLCRLLKCKPCDLLELASDNEG